MAVRIALAGNPNSGKTTLFNNLTGSNQYVGNWPGVTVEKKEGRLRGVKDARLIDLPGIYSLSPYTLEEVITRDYLLNETPDAIINIIDASNFERNCYLTTQLLELGIPMVVALNMMDVVEKNGDKVDAAVLTKVLGCPVLPISALKSHGLDQLVKSALDAAQQKQVQTMTVRFDTALEQTLTTIENALSGRVPEQNKRWYAVKVFERDEKVQESLNLPANIRQDMETAIKAVEEARDDISEGIIANARYEAISAFVTKVVKKHAKLGDLTTSDKIDRIVTNRILALPIFVVVMFLVYYVSISTVGSMMTDWVNDVLFGEWIPGAVEGWLVSAGAADWLSSLVLDGIIAGVGAVLGFLPQMLVLFLFLAILEDCGYMARIAFIMDRIFRKFGLSGKSFIPMLIGTGCGVPAVMASRTIENERDRRLTITTTTFVPCGAKLPIIALIAGALFNNAGWVATSAYFIGVGAIIISGIILKKFRGFAGDPAPFVMELPAYHLPGFKTVVFHMWDRGKSFVRRAGTIIFLASALIWFLSSFSWRMEMVDAGDSMLAAIGGFIAPIFAPLGWGNWEATVAAITGLIAKENVVSTMAILYGYAGEVAEDGVEIWGNMRLTFSALAAYSFLVFNLLCAPCFAAIGAIKREMGSWKWTLFAVGYQTALAYVISLIVYQLGLLFTGEVIIAGAVTAILLLAVLLWLLFRPDPGLKVRTKKSDSTGNMSAAA